MSLTKQPLTTQQLLGKERCWLVRQFGARPWVTSEFWITRATPNAVKVMGQIRSANKRSLQKGVRLVLVDYLCATKLDAEKLRDELKAVSPLPEYMSMGDES